jgi:two-component system sensor histidine kinase QseC
MRSERDRERRLAREARARRRLPAAADSAAAPAWHRRQRAWWRHRHHHRRHLGMSLGRRLLGVFVVASLLSVLVAALVLKAAFEWWPVPVLSHRMGEQADWLVQHLQWDPAGRPLALREPPERAWVYGETPHDWQYRVLAADGTVLLASGGAGAAALAPAGATFDPTRARFDVVEDGLLLHAVTQPVAHRRWHGYVQTAISERTMALFRGAVVGPVLHYALLISGVSLLIFSFGIHLSLQHLLRPLRRASAAASRIAPRNLETRLATSTVPRELRPLIRAFNQALDRLEQGYRVQQEFLASAAHELKTPLALLRGQVELSDSPDRALLLADIDRMARQVHQLLHLAEASEARNYAWAPVDVAAVAIEVATFLERIAQRARVRLDVQAHDGCAPQPADHGAVFVLLKNLAENAIQHSPPGACVTIAIDADGIAVRDEGPGVAPEHAPELFKRFWRGPARRDSGAGLGLAICHEVATAHGWRIEVRRPAAGAEFVVVF